MDWAQLTGDNVQKRDDGSDAGGVRNLRLKIGKQVDNSQASVIKRLANPPNPKLARVIPSCVAVMIRSGSQAFWTDTAEIFCCETSSDACQHTHQRICSHEESLVYHKTTAGEVILHQRIVHKNIGSPDILRVTTAAP
jgi:hypothetical protein